MVSQHIEGLAGELNATIGKKMTTSSNFMLWTMSLRLITHTQLYRYHSKNHHLNALKLPFNFYIERSPIEYVLIHYIDYWDLELDYSRPLRNH